MHSHPFVIRHGAPLLAFLLACSEESSKPEAKAPVAPLGMNDVSVLVPLTASTSAAGSLRPTLVGAKGQLFPKDVYGAIPEFPVIPDQGLDYSRMRAVSIRFDGCFPGKSGCEAQIRLVLQPLTDKGATLDSSIHLFYALPDTEFADVVAGLRSLRAVAPESKVDAPLDVNPALVAQGLDGAYATGLRDLVLEHAGADNLVRMTFFLRAPPLVETWFFGGFSRTNGKLEQLDIVGVGKSNQRVIRDEVDGGYSFDLLPAPTVPENGAALLTSAGASAATAEARKAAFASYLRLENPSKYGPDQLPCAGCHLASFLAANAATTWGLDRTAFPDDLYTSKRDLSVKGESQTTMSSLRAFGYFETKPMIAPRVVNETAAVLDDIEARFSSK